MNTALITGASRGLGLALAHTLAQSHYQLIINGRGEKALQNAADELSRFATIIALSGDVADSNHRKALSDAAESLGGLDAVINNASILGPSPQPELLAYPLSILESVYRTNVIAPLGVLQAVQHQLKPGAQILNITSDAAVETYKGWGGYGSSKAALEHWTRILAAERPDLHIYAVDPGDMQTHMHQEAFPGQDISDRPLPETSVPGLVELVTGTHLSGRYKARDLVPEPV